MSTTNMAPAPTPIEAPDFQTMCEAFRWTVERVPDRVAIRESETGLEITWKEYDARVRAIAAGLAAQGIGRGDSVAMLLTNRADAMLVDTAAVHLGATPFSIYATASVEQIDYVINHAEARLLVTEAAFAPIVDALPSSPLERIYVVDGENDLAALEAAGSPDFDFDAVWKAVRPDDILVLIYTSGTTGPPKGVQLTHDNLLSQSRSLSDLVEPLYDANLVSYLPMAHLADRVIGLYPGILSGSTVTCVRDPRTILSVLPSVRPTSFFSVPRMWEKLKSGLESKAGPDIVNADEATKAGVRYALGLDQALYLASGSAPIAPDILSFFQALGLPILEGWGLSETSASGTLNPPGAIRVGTVGKAVPGMEIKVAEDGELLLRGPAVMTSYRKDDEKTAEALDAEGWLHSGDIGTIDEDGYVRVVDRKKELIITAGGKNISPANIENTAKGETWLIGSIVAIGDRRPYITALVTVDPEIAAEFDGDVEAEIAAAIERANARLSRAEAIKRFKLLAEPWLPGTEELTPTMKLRRKPIAEKYAAEIDALYAG